MPTVIALTCVGESLRHFGLLHSPFSPEKQPIKIAEKQQVNKKLKDMHHRPLDL